MKGKPTATSNRKLDLGRKEGIFWWNTVMQAKIWGKPPTKEKQAREEGMKPPMLTFHVSWTAYSYFKKAQFDTSTLSYIPVSVASWDTMCHTGSPWTWGGAQVKMEEQGSLWPPPVQHLWHEEGHLIQLQSGGATSKPSVRGFVPSCLWYPGELKSSMWLLVVIRRKGWKKNPWLFVSYVAWENTCCLQWDLTAC